MSFKNKKLKIKVAVVTEDQRWILYQPLRTFKARAASIFQQTLLRATVPFNMCEICVTLTNNERIQVLNHQYRGLNKATNVLSFPQNYSTNLMLNEDLSLLLGDIVISIDKVTQEAEVESKTFEHHLNHLLVHAALHLIGYDHMTDHEAKKWKLWKLLFFNTLKSAIPIKIIFNKSYDFIFKKTL